MRTWRYLSSAVLLLALGCGGASPQARKGAEIAMPEPSQAQSPAAAGAKSEAPDAKAAPPAEALPRKIIYTAEAQMVVQEFESAEQQLIQAIKDHNGYVAQAETGGKSGTPRTGRWKVRVPVERFDAFLEAVAGLGVPQRISRDSKDVTEEFYDVEARLMATQVQEARLLKHLEASTGKLTEILEVERELTRVRGEVEQQEGRLRLLANLTSLTTVTVVLQEIKDYVPPQTPSFGNTVSSTFTDSLEALANFGKGLVIGAVALAPWLPLVAVVIVPAWLAVRSRRRSTVTRQRAAPPAGSGLAPAE